MCEVHDILYIQARMEERKMVGIQHIIRYGTDGDKKDLLNMQDKFDCLVINANMLAFHSNTIAKFLAFELKNTPFFIDPLTYAFQRNIRLLYAKGTDNNATEVIFKKSIHNLVDSFPTLSVVLEENRALKLEEISDESNLLKLCEEDLKFQMELLKDSLSEGNDADFFYFENDDTTQLVKEKVEPIWIVAPYFYLDYENLEWLKINKRLCERMREVMDGAEVHKKMMVQLLMSKDILCNIQILEQIAGTYSDMDCDGVLIWIDDFDETKATREELEGFVYLLKKLQNKLVYNLYGSFFSVVLTNDEIGLLNGVGHGMEYGESRSAFPVGGGIPSSKYYFLPIHQRMDFQMSYQLLHETGIIDLNEKNWGDADSYFREICKCAICKDILKEGMIGFTKFQSTELYEINYKTHTSRRAKPTPETKKYCRIHYLECKTFEYLFARKKSIEQIHKDLCKMCEKYNDLLEERNVNANYLSTWSDVLSTFIRDSL